MKKKWDVVFRSATVLACILVGVIHGAYSQVWEQLGPGAGGQILMIEGDMQSDSVMYIGSDVAGLWRSTNAQATDPTYEFLTGGLNLKYCQDIEQDPADAATLLIATEEGVYRSINNGGSWEKFGVDLNDGYVSSISVRRKVDGMYRLYAGIGYTRDNQQGGGCIYRYQNSTSASAPWTRLSLPCSSSAVVYQVVANPSNS